MKPITLLSTISKRHIFSQSYLRTSFSFYSTENAGEPPKKMETLFLNPEVQNILKKVTGLDFEKIFTPRKGKLFPHKYEFATDERLEQLERIYRAKAYKMLQMPPVMDIREPISEILSKDPELQGYLKNTTIFTDLSSSSTNRDRIITVREIDGTLRKASWEERERMNQIFFPIEGRSFETPKLFESPNLDRLLEENEYIFVLDAACIQFEPDSPGYHKVTSETYEHIRQTKKFNVLRSTRHFGPMAFYFVFRKDMDFLLVDMIQHGLITDASDTVILFCIFHPELKTNAVATDEVEILQDYIKAHAKEKGDLELALQTYLEQQATEENQETENKEATA